MAMGPRGGPVITWEYVFASILKFGSGYILHEHSIAKTQNNFMISFFMKLNYFVKQFH